MPFACMGGPRCRGSEAMLFSMLLVYAVSVATAQVAPHTPGFGDSRDAALQKRLQQRGELLPWAP